MNDRVGQQLGNYRLVRLLGQGGFADVYLGEHIYLHTYAAIKVLHAQLTEETMGGFLNEAQTIGRLRHPNIIRELDFGVQNSTPYLVMDYTPKGTLRRLHPKGSRLSLPTIVHYVKQVADALQYVHDHRFIHRDVKPENIFLESDGKVLLSDFGIAITSNVSSSPVGTLPYMAPEQLEGKAVRASDQYALAIVVYEWLTGRPPFQGDPIQLEYQHRFVSPPPPRELNPSIPPSVEQVVLRALEKNPKRRFPTVKAFDQALEQASKAAEEKRPSFHMQLKYERVRRGWSQADIADKLGCDVKTVGRWERGERLPGPYHRQALSQLFSKTVETFGLLEDKPLQTLQNTGVQENSYNSAIEDFITESNDSLKNLLPGRSVEKQPETQLSLYALAHAELEADDRALIGKMYTLEAGIAQQKPENFVGEPFNIAVQDPTEPLLFHIMLHASPNVELLGGWYQSLRYSPLNVEPQLITCPFRLTAVGESYLLVNFYHERQWLKSIRLEFEAIEQARYSNATRWG